MPIDNAYRYADNGGVRTQTVLLHFGSTSAVARALGIEQPSVSEWGKYPPPLRQIQIERVTGGRLIAEPSCYGKPSKPMRQKRRDVTKAAGA